MMHQLDPILPVMTPKGWGWAQFVWWWTPEQSIYWTVFMAETNEIWTFPNELVRAMQNVSGERYGKPSIPNAPANLPGGPPAS